MKTLILSLTAMVLLIGYGVTGKTADLRDGLILYYDFEEKGDAVIDQSGNKNNGKIQGAAKRAGGKFGGGMEFPETNAFILIPYNSIMDLKDQVTMALWLRADKPKGVTWLYYLISKWNYHAGNGRCYFLGLLDGAGATAYISNDGTDATNKIVKGGKIAYGENKWQHVAATFDGSKYILWIDGQNVNELSFKDKIFVDPAKNGMSVAAGSFGNEGAARFTGVSDEVVVYNRALSQAELKQLIDAPVSAAAVEAAGKLAATWATIKGEGRRAKGEKNNL